MGPIWYAKNDTEATDRVAAAELTRNGSLPPLGDAEGGKESYTLSCQTNVISNTNSEMKLVGYIVKMCPTLKS